ncbi:MAG: methyltransferase [Archaeoglobaceae archaeon]
MIYEPAEDSELLLEAAIMELRREDSVLEVGAGSGFVAEKIVDKCSFLLTTDISPFAVRELRKKGLNVVRTDIAKGIRKKFSLILFNPPYLELEEELKRDFWQDCAVHGGKNGIEIVCRFLDQLDELLEKDGRAIIIASSLNSPAIFDEIAKRGYRYEVIAEKKLFFEKIFAVKIFSRE